MEFCEDPLIFCREDGFINHVGCEIVISIHDNKSHRIPDLIGEVSAHQDLIFLESLVITRSITGYKSKSQCVSTVLVNDLERIDSVAKRLAHLTAL